MVFVYNQIKSYRMSNTRDSNEDSMSPHKSVDVILSIIPKVLKIFPVNITQLGVGTYSYVFGISDTKVIKVYHAEKTLRNEHMDSSDYFEAGAFRETFFNPILDHKNLFKYDSLHHDPELGLYKIGQRMINSINDSFITTNFNENMFFRLLEDMTYALIHLHSYGIIHSDIKQSNILYDKDTNGEIYFKLCDYNISQFCSVVSQNVHNVFTTPNLCDKNEKRSVVTDIYILGATMLCISVARKNNDVISHAITNDVLHINRDKVIEATSETCYKILELMMLPQQSRIYLNHLRNFVELYKQNNLENYLSNYCYNNVRINANAYEMQRLCHYRVMDNITELSEEELTRFKLLHGFDDDYEKIYSNLNHKKTEYDNLYKLLTHVLMNVFNIPFYLAGFLSQSICKYPHECNTQMWINILTEKAKNKIKYKNININTIVKELNEMVLHVCLSEVRINLHLLLCTHCRSMCYEHFQKILLIRTKKNSEQLNQSSLKKLNKKDKKDNKDKHVCKIY